MGNPTSLPYELYFDAVKDCHCRHFEIAFDSETGQTPVPGHWSGRLSPKMKNLVKTMVYFRGRENRRRTQLTVTAVLR